jgi:hypothetical protein
VFECPTDHIGTLESYIPRVSKIITIGWRRAEQHFLKLLAKHLARPNRLPVHVLTETLAQIRIAPLDRDRFVQVVTWERVRMHRRVPARGKRVE